MSVKQSIGACLDSAIGEYGFSENALSGWLTRLGSRFERLKAEAADRSLPHIRILYEEADLAEAQAAYARLVDGAKVVVILGTGGSSLGGQAIAQLGGWNIPGDNGFDARPRPQLLFFDNLDAASLVKGLDALDLAATRFVVISKSGGTAETLSQMLIAIQRLKSAGLESKISQQFLAVTEAEKPGVANGLRDLCKAFAIPTLPHPDDIGGRYSAFSVVGMAPAFARGLDFAAFRQGGRDVIDALTAAHTPADFAPAIGAALNFAFAKERGVRASVLMPYSDRLARFSHWFVQLWAESLGKEDRAGTTPVGAIGPVDQHSQLQLYLGGDRHQFVTIVRASKLPEGDTPSLDEGLAKTAGAPYLAGHTVGELVMAQSKAISDAFTEHKRPVRVMEYDQLDERTLGSLMMHFVMETILAADLYGVDPFDQPAVELGKRLTKEYLARMDTAAG
ncbi:MAG: glucose-6-phosphate isomerase [Alphaproteobacteria bacterium]